MTRALVLSGGGPVGIGWEAGVVSGLAAQGVDVSLADYILGTSAGSVVGAQIALGRDVSEISQRMRANAASPSRPRPGATGEQMQGLMQAFMELFTSTEPDQVKRAKIGAFALEATTMSEEEFLTTFGHLADAGWPKRYACTAVDALTGEFVVWDEAAGAPLVRAVATSCSVPGIFPPITIDGRRYIDGGMRSGTNADLAKGHERVLILSLMNPESMRGPLARLGSAIEAELTTIGDAGGTVEVVYPDPDAASAMGVNLMDPSMVIPAVEAGERQGKLVADELGGFWN